jgi:hypothetical protein
VYLGAVDFVVRTSRSHSIWWPVVDKDGDNAFDAGAEIISPTFGEPVVEPRPENQPNGTSITFEFRGASSMAAHGPITEGAATPDGTVETDEFWCLQAANRLDPYGDAYDPDRNISTCDGSPNFNTLAFDGLPQVNLPVTFLNSDNTWKDLASEIDGATYYQVRVNFTSNAETGLSPMLSAFGMTYRQN